MSYAIFTVVYGVPLTEAAAELIDEWEGDVNHEKWFEDEHGTCGFTMLYTAGGPMAGFCGAKLATFDEACDYFKLDDIVVAPTQEQVDDALKRVARLPPELQVLCPDPGVYVVPSSS